jgi:mono/diheme cytochrome c family protein
MAALSLMPIWVFMYVRSLTAPPVVAEGPMGVGTEQYGNCSSCHGGGGEGGAGRQLNEGEVDKTFPHIEDQIRFVYFGTEQYNLAGVTIYGDPAREGGAHETGSFGVMPGWGALAGGDLTDAEILAVVCHERFGLSGAPDITSAQWADEYEHWCSEESPIFAALEGGTSFGDLASVGVTDAEGNAIQIEDIGTAPREGSS